MQIFSILLEKQLRESFKFLLFRFSWTTNVNKWCKKNSVGNIDFFMFFHTTIHQSPSPSTWYFGKAFDVICFYLSSFSSVISSSRTSSKGAKMVTRKWKCKYECFMSAACIISRNNQNQRLWLSLPRVFSFNYLVEMKHWEAYLRFHMWRSLCCDSTGEGILIIHTKKMKKFMNLIMTSSFVVVCLRKLC